MGFQSYTIGLFFFILLYSEYCSAIKCYECNSFVENKCIQEFKTFEKNCTENDDQEYKFCRKIKQIIDFEVDGKQPEDRIIRACGWDAQDDEEKHYTNKCYQRGGFGGKQIICSCDTDYCNNSSGLCTTFSLVIMAVLLAWYHTIIF